MIALRDLQGAVRRAAIEGDDAGAPGIRHPRLPTATVLAIHQRHFAHSLATALAATFPAVVRLVDERFFAYAAAAFVRAQPPRSPCLADYGAELADFLAAFAPCAHLAWLPDAARLEWALHCAAIAPAFVPAERAALARVPPEQIPALRLKLDPSLQLLASPWPIDRIVEAQHSDDPAPIDPHGDPVRLQVRRIDRMARSRRLAPGDFAFRTALLHGAALADAFDGALDAEPDFDLARALGGLFDENLAAALAAEPSPSVETTR
jgi:hypothetical protein